MMSDNAGTNDYKKANFSLSKSLRSEYKDSELYINLINNLYNLYLFLNMSIEF